MRSLITISLAALLGFAFAPTGSGATDPRLPTTLDAWVEGAFMCYIDNCEACLLLSIGLCAGAPEEYYCNVPGPAGICQCKFRCPGNLEFLVYQEEAHP